jgi:hypothetical protein
MARAEESHLSSSSQVFISQHIGDLETEYKTAIPPYYFSLINTEDPEDPIRRQIIPLGRELNAVAGTSTKKTRANPTSSPIRRGAVDQTNVPSLCTMRGSYSAQRLSRKDPLGWPGECRGRPFASEAGASADRLDGPARGPAHTGRAAGRGRRQA